MRDILLSIRDTHLEAIVSGQKAFEFRSWLPRSVGKVWVYQKAPVAMVVGFIQPAGLIVPQATLGDLDALAHQLMGAPTGLDPATFIKLGGRRGTLGAIAIASFQRITPKPVQDYGLKRGPQAIVYVDALEASPC